MGKFPYPPSLRANICPASQDCSPSSSSMREYFLVQLVVSVPVSSDSGVISPVT